MYTFQLLKPLTVEHTFLVSICERLWNSLAMTLSLYCYMVESVDQTGLSHIMIGHEDLISQPFKQPSSSSQSSFSA
jgi:hypothetical protein